jgi:hypothetical protein
MKTLKKLVLGGAAFTVIMVSIHHATWYATTIFEYGFYLTIMCLAIGVLIVTVES